MCDNRRGKKKHELTATIAKQEMFTVFLKIMREGKTHLVLFSKLAQKPKLHTF